MAVVEAPRPPADVSSLPTPNRRPLAVRVVLVPLAAVLYALGWAAGRVVWVLAWVWAALAVGWGDGRRPGAEAG